MSHGGDPYGILPSVPGLSFAHVFSSQNSPTIAYLPFWPIVTGLMYALYSLIGLGDRFAYYFLLKQPVIIGDVGLAYLLYRYVSARKPRRSVWVLLLWLFSPFTIIISGIWGMFDSVAMAFIIISIMTTGPLKQGFWVGMGIFAKSIPIVHAIPATVKQARGSLGMLLAIGLPALFSITTFLVMRWPLPTIETTLLSTAGTGGESMSVWDSFFYFNYLGLLPPLEPNVARILGLLWIPALIALTVVAFRRFRFDTDYGLVQSLIVTTLAFLIFKARVTEQYGIYLFALFAIDVSLWNPKRKRLMLVTMAVVLVYLVTNNYFLIRFLSPVYPNFTEVELRMYQEIGGIRYAAKFLLGSLFTYLNIRYLVAAMNRKA